MQPCLHSQMLETRELEKLGSGIDVLDVIP